MAEAELGVLVVFAALGCGHHVALVFNGSRSEQSFPMRGPSLGEEGRRDKQNLSTFKDELSIELREANVVGDAQP